MQKTLLRGPCARSVSQDLEPQSVAHLPPKSKSPNRGQSPPLCSELTPLCPGNFQRQATHFTRIFKFEPHLSGLDTVRPPPHVLRHPLPPSSAPRSFTGARWSLTPLLHVAPAPGARPAWVGGVGATWEPGSGRPPVPRGPRRCSGRRAFAPPPTVWGHRRVPHSRPPPLAGLGLAAFMDVGTSLPFGPSPGRLNERQRGTAVGFPAGPRPPPTSEAKLGGDGEAAGALGSSGRPRSGGKLETVHPSPPVFWKRMGGAGRSPDTQTPSERFPSPGLVARLSRLPATRRVCVLGMGVGWGRVPCDTRCPGPWLVQGESWLWTQPGERASERRARGAATWGWQPLREERRAGSVQSERLR